MIKVGITGQAGFVGTHLYYTLGLYPGIYERIFFEDSFFTEINKLSDFVIKCDVIVHLAALNRHNDPDVIYRTNINLVKQLIETLENTKSTPHIVFASSTQEELENAYGRSKREGRGLFEDWAKRNNASFTGFIIPNVFGPFGNPFYNSVVSTFCYQTTHNLTPKIDVDSEVKLIYVSDLVNTILQHIKERHQAVQSVLVDYSKKIKVSSLKSKIEEFKYIYLESGIIPDISDDFERNLFNTFVCYIDHQSYFPHALTKNSDTRGTFVEILKAKTGGQISFSTTEVNVTRGNHFHTRKFERFAVIRGKAVIQIRRIGTDKVISFKLDGDNPSYVDMPIWFTHNIENVGTGELYTLFWINESFDPLSPDTYYEKV